MSTSTLPLAGLETGTLGRLGLLALRVPPELAGMAQPAQPALVDQVPRAQAVLMAQQDRRDLPELRVPALRAPQDLLGPTGSTAARELQVLADRAARALQALRGLRECRALRAPPELQARLVRQDLAQREPRALRE
jgi:hypothetical protein